MPIAGLQTAPKLLRHTPVIRRWFAPKPLITHTPPEPLNQRVVGSNPTAPWYKAILRQAAARTVDDLWDVIAQSLDDFTPSECRNYFAAAGDEPE